MTFCRTLPEHHVHTVVRHFRGTLDLLVLNTSRVEPMHCWGISQRMQQFSRGVLDVNQGSLYPALQRLEQMVGRQHVGRDRKQREG